MKYSGAFGEDELKEVAEILNDLQISLFDLSGDLSLRAIELAMRMGITVYDASYIALAESFGTIAYTADERLLKKVRGAVRHVKDVEI